MPPRQAAQDQDVARISETAINAKVETGGVAGVVGAAYVHIENLTQYATPPAPAPAEAGPVPSCPYPGLAYFGPQDSARFFGRDGASRGWSAPLRSAVSLR